MVTEWDLRFLGLAQYIATWSKDPSTKCGAVITASNNSVMSVGFNGFPARMRDDAELYQDREVKLSRIIHAEMNSLLFANRKMLPEGCTLYTHPFMPCDRCCVQFIQAGIRRYVAPSPTQTQAERWGDSFSKTRKYILEVGGDLIEYSIH